MAPGVRIQVRSITMIQDVEQRLSRLEAGLKKAEAATEKKQFQTYLKTKMKRLIDELSFKEWMIFIVAIYLAACIGVLISKGLG
jgi:hypothetical protein